MNMEEQIHNVRKEYWRTLIRQCDASGKLQKDWCQENGICSTSMSTWRSQLRREEAAEKEFAAAKEEHCFVEIKAETEDNILDDFFFCGHFLCVFSGHIVENLLPVLTIQSILTY